MLLMPFAMGPLPRCRASGTGTSRLRIQILSWHKEQAPPAGSYDGLERMSKMTCEGLNITFEQFHAELIGSGDISDPQSGALTPKALRLMAKTLALMRYPYPPELRVRGTTLHGVRVVSESKTTYARSIQLCQRIQR